ncbi:TRAF3-interacting protein 1 [Saguinus oedipus]|uniref:TRAF3-interacting protein 1 n=1 Tax=Saguinus oedipus TaxID=9490 RepID=A0ABQ9VFK5_SAGOE|nr:TRAF3-interacting protein 1 [Saguinus oedipus]
MAQYKVTELEQGFPLQRALAMWECVLQLNGIFPGSGRDSAHPEMGRTKEANINSTSISDDNSASLRCEIIEPDSAVKQKDALMRSPVLCDSASDAEGDAGPAGQDQTEVSEIPEIPNEFSSSIRRIPRPGSARPAPPRVKRQDSAEALPLER